MTEFTDTWFVSVMTIITSQYTSKLKTATQLNFAAFFTCRQNGFYASESIKTIKSVLPLSSAPFRHYRILQKDWFVREYWLCSPLTGISGAWISHQPPLLPVHPPCAASPSSPTVRDYQAHYPCSQACHQTLAVWIEINLMTL